MMTKLEISFGKRPSVKHRMCKLILPFPVSSSLSLSLPLSLFLASYGTGPALEMLLGGERHPLLFESVLSHREHTRFQFGILLLSHTTTARAKLRVLAFLLPLAGDWIDRGNKYMRKRKSLDIGDSKELLLHPSNQQKGKCPLSAEQMWL